MLKKLELDKRIAYGAADGLRKYGHTKGALYRDGAMCILGALIFSASEEDTPTMENTQFGPRLREQHSVEVNRVINWIMMRVGERQNIILWNNARERTAEEVIQVLEEYAMS